MLNHTIPDIWHDTHSLSLGLLGSLGQSGLESTLLPLTPSADLDDHSSVLNTRDTLRNFHVNPTHSPPDHLSLLAESPSEDVRLELNEESSLSTFNMNLLTEDHLDSMGSSLCSQNAPCPESHASVDVNFRSSGFPPSSSAPSLEDNTQDFSKSPSSVFLGNDEDVDDEDGLPGSLGDLLEDAAILDEIRLLDLALEEGFSPEMAVKLEEEGYLDREVSQREPGQDMISKEQREDNHSGVAVTEEQGQTRSHQQGN